MMPTVSVIRSKVLSFLSASNHLRIQSRMLKTRSIIGRNENVNSTINPKEVKAFSEQMEWWWYPEGLYRALHSLNDIRVPYIVEGMAKYKLDNTSLPLTNLRLLDVGCGGGILSEALAKQGAAVTGIDASSELIDVAIQHSNSATFQCKPSYFCTTIEEHSESNANHYDGVIASEVIEHVNNQGLFVKSCVQALKPNGRVFFTAPSKTRLSQFLNIWLAENIINNPPKGTHQYENFISYTDLRHLLEKNGCHVESIRGFFLNMVTNKWSWTRTRQLFYAIQAVKL